MSKTIFCPLFHNFDEKFSEKHNYRLCYNNHIIQAFHIENIWYRYRYCCMCMSTENIEYICPITIKQFNKIMKYLFYNDEIWLSKVCIEESKRNNASEYDDFLKLNNTIKFEVKRR